MTDEIGRDEPLRTLSKQQAIRHLIHAAARLIIVEEDPFAVHLLVQAADNLLIDVSNRTGKPLVLKWDDLLSPEGKKAFLTLHRQTANFFKHADRDHEKLLTIGHIHEYTVLNLGVCIANYWSLYEEWTEHMQLIFEFVKIINPSFMLANEDPQEFAERSKIVSHMTPSQFFDDIAKSDLSHAYPNLNAERRDDTQDVRRFNDTPMEVLAARTEP
jgi:hypothetical protein